MKSMRMEDRLQKLERTLADILERVQRLEDRLDIHTERETVAADAASHSGVDEASGSKPLLPSGAMFARLLQLVGRTCLVLGVAFLIRALSDGRVLSVNVGIALALAVATTSIVFSDRAAKSGRRLSAAFHGLTAVLIAYPLVVETTTRLGAMSASTAAVVLVGTTTLQLFVAWRHNLAKMAWLGVAASLLAIFALMQSTGITAALTLVLVLLTAATWWLAENRSWNAPRWPAALLLDAVLLRSILSSAQDNHAVRDRLLIGFAFAVLILLPTLIGVAYRTLARRKPLTAFHALQTVAALSLGLVAAVYASRAYHWSTAATGGLALVLAMGALLVSLSPATREKLTRSDYLFYLASSAGLLFAGGVLATTGELRGLLWATLAVAAAAMGHRTHRVSLSAYSALLLWAGAITSGVLRTAADGLLAGPRHWSAPDAAGLVVLGIALASYWLTATRQDEQYKGTAVARIPATAMLVLCAISFGALLVHAERTALGSRGDDPALIATARTVALAVIATVLALSERRMQWAELSWVAYLILGLGGLKLVTEDLPQGRAFTLLVAFATYGIALIAVQRLVRPFQGSPP